MLWTRLMAAPQGDPLPASPIEVGWELASDADFRRVVRSGRVLALPQEAHSVHVEVGACRMRMATILRLCIGIALPWGKR